MEPDPPRGGDGAESQRFTAGSTFRICLSLAEISCPSNAMRPQPNACFRSTIRSSGSSIPTEMRMSVGVIGIHRLHDNEKPIGIARVILRGSGLLFPDDALQARLRHQTDGVRPY